MSTHRPARKSGNQEAAGFFARAARSTVKNGRRTTLIARKLAATASAFVSHWEWGQILLIPGVLWLAVSVGCRTTFPESEHSRHRAAPGSCVPRMMARVSRHLDTLSRASYCPTRSTGSLPLLFPSTGDNFAGRWINSLPKIVGPACGNVGFYRDAHHTLDGTRVRLPRNRLGRLTCKATSN